MLKERAKTIVIGVLLVDLSAVTAAFFLSYWARNDLLPRLGLLEARLYPIEAYTPLLPPALLIFASLLLAWRTYHSQRTGSILNESWRLLKVAAASMLLLVLVAYLLRFDALHGTERLSRLWLATFGVLSFLLLCAERIGLRILARYTRAGGRNFRVILFVGVNDRARRMAETIEQHSHWGFRILGFLTNRVEPDTGGYPALGGLSELERVIDENVVDEVIFSVSRENIDSLEDMLLLLEERGVCSRLALDLFPHVGAKVEIGELEGIPLLTLSTAPTSSIRLAVKRFVDIGLSLTMLTLALPLLALIAVLIKLTSPGTVLFRQVRSGLNGREFTLYKFRSMVSDAEQRRSDLAHLNEMDGPVFKISSDPRVTRVGRFLRKFSLDELPQLWNVLKGDMSLVGPRPPVPDEVRDYKPWQRRRLSMRPGLTCLWQISGRSQVDFDRWMRLDLEYIDSWSPLLDIKILAKTVPAVLLGRGAY